MPVEKQAYREAMARLGAAVNVVTTDGPGGRGGFTASAVTSVTDDPPTLLVCANRTNELLPGDEAEWRAVREHAYPGAGGSVAGVRGHDPAHNERTV